MTPTTEARSPSEQLKRLGLVLPQVVAPLASYVPATRVGTQVWTSGQLPMVDGTLQREGIVGADLDVDEAAACARTAALNALAAAAQVAGGIDRLTRVLKVVVYVASEVGFTSQPAVGNGASLLLGEVFGEAGRHVRSAVGVAVLPLNAPVEVELVVDTAPVDATTAG